MHELEQLIRAAHENPAPFFERWATEAKHARAETSGRQTAATRGAEDDWSDV